MSVVKKLIISMSLLVAPLASQVQAGTYHFVFAGPGVAGDIELTYGAATDAKYADAFVLTGISGVFSYSDGVVNIVDAAVGPLVATQHDTPDPTNLLAPDNFSRFAVASGLPPTNNGTLSYTNLIWPGGSPQTASDYAFHGGILDIYGLLFEIGGGMYVNLWSNGVLPGSNRVDYGVAVVTRAEALGYIGGVSAVPEPGSFVLLGMAMMAALGGRRATSARRR
ncbi:MAG: hypothetical protein BGO49_30965 [Planctomycetales bacterium 71-10]|nr:MAG: hypothetical protein BGO49_30965 [Planctomycetales bacterium 71-10]